MKRLTQHSDWHFFKALILLIFFCPLLAGCDVEATIPGGPVDLNTTSSDSDNSSDDDEEDSDEEDSSNSRDDDDEDRNERDSESDDDDFGDDFDDDFGDAQNNFDASDPFDPLAESSSEPSNRSGRRCPQMVEGPPLGIACLHCGEPKAREQAIRIASILGKSCRENIATTMLIDGTFSDDQDVLKKVISTATARGSRLHLFLYMSNGPWQRRYKTVPQKGIGTKISPEEFRRRIHWDRNLIEKYQQRIEWALPLIKYAQSRGSVVYVMPMLEDNLDREAARKMEELTLEAIPPDLAVALGRNPCTSCYRGNDGSVPEGLFLDQHAHSKHSNIRARGGLVTNDGKTFTFPHEESESNKLTFDGLKTLAKNSLAKNNSFVIWRGEYQGIHGRGLKDPARRNYSMPNGDDEEALLELLRDGRQITGGSASSSSNLSGSFSPTKIRRFLWKPRSERDGKLVVLVDPEEVEIKVIGSLGETLKDFGPSNGRGTTSRASKTGCDFGKNVEVELRDSAGRLMRLADGSYPIIVKDGCDRDDRNF